MAKQSSDKTNVRRITATDDTPKKQSSAAKKPSRTADKTRKATKTKTTSSATDIKKLPTDIQKMAPASKNPFVAIGRYFREAWYELRQVRWPDRKTTWSMTGAVLIFTAFFVIYILLLDGLFKWLFETILK